ncbi:MAG: indolepyruvate oxidoreductase subunit beta [Desulfobacteraceae bacterium]|nr:indolepyruvate oxidoreductase subunit beta [Desulfobacteraceae bacterium]
MTLDFDPLNIIVSGVGGQGNILASDLISRAFCEEGYFVSVGETYGATQRGGSVVSHIRLSRRRAYGPLIPLGESHIIIGFEPLEVYRISREYGHDAMRVIMNDRPFYPLDVLRQQNDYPDMEQLVSCIRRLAADLKIIKGTDLAKKAGHAQTQNVVMVGAFAGSHWVPLGKERFSKALEETFSDAKLEVNRRAFESGYQAAL